MFEGKDYFPELKVGTRQLYDIEYRGALGEPEKANMILSVDSEETINGHQYYKYIIAYSGLPGVDQDVVYQRWTSAGIYAIDGRNADMRERLDTPFPVAVGSKWTSESPSETDHYEAIGIESLELREHTYRDCLKLSFDTQSKNGPKRSGVEYLADGIGMVKTEVSGGALGADISITIDSSKK